MVNLYLTPLKSKPEKTSFNQETIVTLSFESKMTAKAVLLCRPNSHPFQERTLVLDQPVKVGRSVARARPAPNNGIFDCKVLSRNHALLWYENGKFFLQDTKSSNGTFVNNQRLSKGSDESPPREVCSGDIVQFGVDVMENSRKVTHGCIVATLKLFLPDGKEAKASPSTVMLPTCPSTITQQDLYQLAQYLQEAVHREQILQDKIATLQKLVTNTEESANLSWKAMIDEDRLLSRLEILESQFRACSKNLSEDALREEVIRLQEDKERYQVTSKESLKKVLLENMEVAHKLQDAERVLMNTENEYKNLKHVHDVAQNEIKELAEKYNAGLKEIQELNEKLVQLEINNGDEKSVNEDEKKPSIIISDFSENDLTVKKENYKSIIGDSQGDFKSLISTQGVQVNINACDNDLEGEFKESEIELVESKTKLADINKLLDKAQVEAVKSMNKVSQLEVNLNDAKLKTESNSVIIKQLQEKIEQLEQELSAAKETKDSSDRLTIVYKSEVEPITETITLPLPGRRKSSEIHNGELSTPNQLQSEICKLKELLQETRENKLQAEKEVSKYKSEIEDARDGIKKANDDCNSLRLQLQTAQQQVSDKANSVARLRDQLKDAESTSIDGQLQLNSLKDKLSLDEQRYKQKQEEIENLRQQLSEVMHNYKQSHNEAEQLRNKFETLTKQVEEHSSELIDEEYSSLRRSHQELEAEINNVKAENTKLRENHANAVQNVCHPDSSLREDSADQEDVEATKRKLMEAYAHIVNLKETCAAYNAERTRLHHEMNSNQEFHMPAYTLYPLLVALFGVLVVFYPKLMLITATLEPSMPP